MCAVPAASTTTSGYVAPEASGMGVGRGGGAVGGAFVEPLKPGDLYTGAPDAGLARSRTARAPSTAGSALLRTTRRSSPHRDLRSTMWRVPTHAARGGARRR